MLFPRWALEPHSLHGDSSWRVLGASFASESRFGFASAPRLGGSCVEFHRFPGAPIDVSSQLNVELLRSSLVHLSVEREGLGAS